MLARTTVDSIAAMIGAGGIEAPAPAADLKAVADMKAAVATTHVVDSMAALASTAIADTPRIAVMRIVVSEIPALSRTAASPTRAPVPPPGPGTAMDLPALRSSHSTASPPSTRVLIADMATLDAHPAIQLRPTAPLRATAVRPRPARSVVASAIPTVSRSPRTALRP